MAGTDELLSRLTDNSSFLDWLRGNAKGRGVPSWDPTTAGRSGGYPGREPGMPRAPGNSPNVGRLGGTYAPSGNMPVPLGGGGLPAVGGSGIGSLSASPPSGVIGGSGGVNFNRFPATGGVGALAPLIPWAAQKDVGMPKRHLNLGLIDKLMGGRESQAAPRPQSNGGQMMPVPNAPAASPPAQPIPPVGGMGGPQPTQAAPAPLWEPKVGTLPWPQTPMPRPRPQTPTPRPSPIAKKPPMPQADPRMAQASQNKSIIDTLLDSFNPNAEWRKQYAGRNFNER